MPLMTSPLLSAWRTPMRMVSRRWMNFGTRSWLRLPTEASPERHGQTKPAQDRKGRAANIVEQQLKNVRRKATSQKEKKMKTKALWLIVSVSPLCCAAQDSDALASQGTKAFRGNPMQKVLNATQRVRFTKSTLRHASIWDKKGPPLGKYKSNLDISEVFTLSNSRIGFHDETERQERCAQSEAWDLAKHLYKLKANDNATFFSPAEKWVLPSASAREPEETEFMVHSGASMHMVSENDLHSAELETLRTSRSPTTVMANGEVRTNEEATENFKQLDLFVTVMLLQETPAVLSLRKLCEEHGYTYHWKSGQKPHLIKKGKRTDCKNQTMFHLWFLE